MRGRAEQHVACELIEKAHVAVGALAEMDAIDPHIAVGHNSVENDIDVTMGISGGQGEGLTVPGDSCGEKASRRAAWVGLILRSSDAPIMGHGDCAPGRIVERGLLGMSRVPLKELPLGIEIDDRADGLLCKRG
jgi:hypothetical protein